jgi:hypothetical protein
LALRASANTGTSANTGASVNECWLANDTTYL